jgi:hypothetical protein
MNDAKVILITRWHSPLASGEQERLHHPRVQIELRLGDARGIFETIKVQGASIVLKKISNTSGLMEASTIDEISYQCGVNSVEKCTLLGFFSVDDKHKHVEENLPTFAVVVLELMSEEYQEVDGVK